jgi:hypothetical protein
MGMGVVEGNDRGDVLWVFELPDPLFEPSDSFAEYLCPRLALAVVVLAKIGLLCAGALLTGRFSSITSLLKGRMRV